jgi:uncharacterized protein
MVERTPSIVERSVTTLIRGYQVAISPLFPASCRFYPSCSEYAIEAVKIHGVRIGSGLTLKRLCKCHPWNPGGIDLVPHNSIRRSNSLKN